MLERLQSALKSVKESKPSSMLSHRFVTVRRGSPAARSGQIQPGDQLEAVEGRSVVALPHRDLAQILRRAGNTLRLTIIPRSNTNASILSETAELDADGRLKRGNRGRSKDVRFYSVDLERGPTGFGFSLRGGSEYNMGLYVLGLMEGGPAQRSLKIQVSDQLVEINGDSTSGMTHSQAVEQIRRGGHRIHLVLKKGNGYVPDYDPEQGALSPSSPPFPEEQGLVSVTVTTASLSEQRAGGRTKRKGGERQRKGGGSSTQGGGGGGGRRGTPDLDLDLLREEEVQELEEEQGVDSVTMTTASLNEQRAGGGGRERKRKGGERQRNGGGSSTRGGGGGGDGRGTPDLDLDLLGEEEVQELGEEQGEEERSRGGSRSQTARQNQREQGRKAWSLPRNTAQSWDRLSGEEGWVDGWIKEDRGREKEEGAEGGRERVRQKKRERRSKGQSERRGRETETERGEKERQGREKIKQSRGESEERRDKGRGEREEFEEETKPEPAMHSGTSVSTFNGKAQFSFLMPLDDADNNHPSDSESVASFSEVSLSAASIAPGEVGSEWREHYDWQGAESSGQQGGAPGPWLKPSQQRLTQVLIGSRLRGRDLAGGLSL